MVLQNIFANKCAGSLQNQLYQSLGKENSLLALPVLIASHYEFYMPILLSKGLGITGIKLKLTQPNPKGLKVQTFSLQLMGYPSPEEAPPNPGLPYPIKNRPKKFKVSSWQAKQIYNQNPSKTTCQPLNFHTNSLRSLYEVCMQFIWSLNAVYMEFKCSLYGV